MNGDGVDRHQAIPNAIGLARSNYKMASFAVRKKATTSSMKRSSVDFPPPDASWRN